MRDHVLHAEPVMFTTQAVGAGGTGNPLNDPEPDPDDEDEGGVGAPEEEGPSTADDSEPEADDGEPDPATGDSDPVPPTAA